MKGEKNQNNRKSLSSTPDRKAPTEETLHSFEKVSPQLLGAPIPSWGLIAKVVGSCFAIVSAIVGVLYYNLRDDVRRLEVDSKHIQQGLSEIKVDTAVIKESTGNIKEDLAEINRLLRNNSIDASKK